MKYTMLLAILTTLLVTVAAECNRSNGKAFWNLNGGLAHGLFYAKKVEDVHGTLPTEKVDQCKAKCDKTDNCFRIYVKEEPFECWTQTGNKEDLVNFSGFTIYDIVRYKCVDDCTNGKVDWESGVKGREYSGGIRRWTKHGTGIDRLQECKRECEKLNDCAAINFYDYVEVNVVICDTLTESEYKSGKSFEFQNWAVYKLKSNCNGECDRSNGMAVWTPQKGVNTVNISPLDHVTDAANGKPIKNLKQCKEACVKTAGCRTVYVQQKPSFECWINTGRPVNGVEMLSGVKSHSITEFKCGPK